jgi:chaperonin GroES
MTIQELETLAAPYEILSDNVLVLEDPMEEETASGLVLPGTRRKGTTRTGTVIKLGPGRMLPDYTRSRMTVRPGDHIAFELHSGTSVKYKGTDFSLVSEKSVLAVLERNHD